jgi:predicted ArsR family transcriptional regulator
VERAEDQEVLQFILENLETVPHLEAALLIWQNQSTEWTADLLARRIYVSSAAGRGILEDLTRQGMLRKSEPSGPIYMYDPAWDAERGMLPRVAELYRRQLVQVTKLIHSKGSSSVREFARAFQIKKEQ